MAHVMTTDSRCHLQRGPTFGWDHARLGPDTDEHVNDPLLDLLQPADAVDLDE